MVTRVTNVKRLAPGSPLPHSRIWNFLKLTLTLVSKDGEFDVGVFLLRESVSVHYLIRRGSEN